MKSLSWTPTRRGEIYCSPACGNNCLHISYLKAHDMADAVVRQLGRGWKKEVWENLGWHFRVIFDGAIVVTHIERDNKYVAGYNSYREYLETRSQDPKFAVKSLVRMCIKQFRDEAVRATESADQMVLLERELARHPKKRATKKRATKKRVTKKRATKKRASTKRAGKK